MKPVNLLARIRVATPCRADWNEMTGDERVRHCAHCDKNVFNLSEMSREQAEALIIAKNGDLCARYYQRHDGTILLADCSVGVAQKRKTRVAAAGALALLAGTPVAALSLRTKAHAPLKVQVEPENTKVLQGDIAEPPDDTLVMQGGVAKPPPHEATEVMGGLPANVGEVEQPRPPEHARPRVKAR